MKFQRGRAEKFQPVRCGALRDLLVASGVLALPASVSKPLSLMNWDNITHLCLFPSRSSSLPLSLLRQVIDIFFFVSHWRIEGRYEPEGSNLLGVPPDPFQYKNTRYILDTCRKHFSLRNCSSTNSYVSPLLLKSAFRK